MTIRWHIGYEVILATERCAFYIHASVVARSSRHVGAFVCFSIDLFVHLHVPTVALRRPCLSLFHFNGDVCSSQIQTWVYVTVEGWNLFRIELFVFSLVKTRSECLSSKPGDSELVLSL